MFTHPVISAAVAEEHRRDLTARADAYRLMRAARQSRPSRAAGPALTVKRVLVTAAAACTAVGVLALTPAGPAHTSASHRQPPTATSHVSGIHRSPLAAHVYGIGQPHGG